MRATQPQGIEGLTGSLPIGAVLRVGGKTPDGRIDYKKNDRYTIAVRHENEKGIRVEHPKFGFFNDAPVEKRQSLAGNFVADRISDVFSQSRRAHKLDGGSPNHPDRVPACLGDGHVARRYAGQAGESFNPKIAEKYPIDPAEPQAGDHVFAEIPCPGDLCEFAQRGSCKPSSVLRMFRPRWPQSAIDAGAPSPAMLFATNSWWTASNLLGFFDHIREVWTEGLGMAGEPPIFGLPFVLGLTRKTQPSKERGFPVTTISTDGDLIEFFRWRANVRKELDGSALKMIAETVEGSFELAEEALVEISVTQPSTD